MNFDLSEDQKLLVQTVASFIKKESPVTRLRTLRADPLGWGRDTWRKMGDQGWLAVSFPEEDGGLGRPFVDVALILAELGATLVPEPVVPLLCAGTALVRAGSKEQRQRFLTPALEGKTTMTLATTERTRPGAPACRAERTSSGWRLAGEKRWVLGGHAADQVIVPARTDEGVALFVVDRQAVEVTPLATIDGLRAAHLRLDDVTVGGDRRLPGDGAAALDEALDVGAAATCAEGHGVMNAALRMTVSYLQTREQFGVKIGTFQALQHRAVDMFVETELAKGTMLLAALKVGDPDPVERRRAVSIAKVQLAESGRYVTQQAIQLHGGIGCTDEADIGLYFKRMHVLATLFGDEEHHLGRIQSLPGFAA